MKEIADILAAEFGPKGWNICTKEAAENDSKKDVVDVAHTKDILGITFTPVEKTVIDMANCMIDSGFVKKSE